MFIRVDSDNFLELLRIVFPYTFRENEKGFWLKICIVRHRVSCVTKIICFIYADAKQAQAGVWWTKLTEINARLADSRNVYRWEWTKTVSVENVNWICIKKTRIECLDVSNVLVR